MSADGSAVVIRYKHVIGTDRDKAGVTDFPLAVKLDQTFGLAQILRAVSPRLSTRIMGSGPCRSEGLRRLPVFMKPP
jgi:hypothetical protein